RFADPSVRPNVTTDLALSDAFDEQMHARELYLTRTAKVDDPHAYQRRRSIPGVGPVRALLFRYEIHDGGRCPAVANFLCYAWRVRGAHARAGKTKGSGGATIGNAPLKWATGAAACLLVRSRAQAKKWLARKEKTHGTAQARGALAARLGRTIYHLLRKQEAFDAQRFFA